MDERPIGHIISIVGGDGPVEVFGLPFVVLDLPRRAIGFVIRFPARQGEQALYVLQHALGLFALAGVALVGHVLAAAAAIAMSRTWRERSVVDADANVGDTDGADFSLEELLALDRLEPTRGVIQRSLDLAPVDHLVQPFGDFSRLGMVIGGILPDVLPAGVARDEPLVHAALLLEGFEPVAELMARHLDCLGDPNILHALRTLAADLDHAHSRSARYLAYLPTV